MSASAIMAPDQITEFKGLLTQISEQYKKLDSDYKTLGKGSSDTLEKLNKLTEDVVAIQTKHGAEAQKRIDTLESKVADLTRNYVEPVKSFGERVCEEKAFIAYLESGSKQGFNMILKAGASLRRSLFGLGIKDIVGLSGLLPEAQSAIASAPRPLIGVRTLVPQGRTTAGAISYLRESAFTNAAAPVAEGAVKPKSDKTFVPTTAPVEVIATYFKVSRQAYEDIPGLSAQIENNGIYGVAAAEDNQLLNGTGVSPQLTGFLKNAVVAPAPPAVVAPAPANTIIDAIGFAVFDLASKGYMPDGAVVNPADYGKMALYKNSTGNYLFANPIDYSQVPRLWGVRIVQSSKIASGTGLVGAFQGNSLLLDREEVNIQVASQSEDDFIRNMLTILIEERLVLLIYNSAAFEKIVTPAAFGAEGMEAPPEQQPEGTGRRR
jgi:HK97 family phage major capsid protein